MFSVYILYSETKSKYYVGQTNDLQNRLNRHNSAQVTSTKYGIRWEVLYTIQVSTRTEAMFLETKIKKRGIKRYLEDIGYL
ncbi:GIY-YIG nuclease family protein [Flavobacterium cerinum]|uniref:GIY-YIG nuclease family protein n=1 Tax=Flavobacterium cerinum TaxID=2502784 RepID=A0A3S3QTL9_9FLAO|nr:GIY-YIG nuclease family protein [Flavobacterium cerinum]